jgi:aminoglycoside/choline kinase family phosphotransferase
MTLHFLSRRMPEARARRAAKGLRRHESSRPIAWADPARASRIRRLAGRRGAASTTCRPIRVRPASADASFRRYFRVDAAAGEASFIVMDAPPAQEDCKPFVKVAGLMAAPA